MMGHNRKAEVIDLKTLDTVFDKARDAWSRIQGRNTKTRADWMLIDAALIECRRRAKKFKDEGAPQTVDKLYMREVKREGLDGIRANDRQALDNLRTLKVDWVKICEEHYPDLNSPQNILPKIRQYLGDQEALKEAQRQADEDWKPQEPKPVVKPELKVKPAPVAPVGRPKDWTPPPVEKLETLQKLKRSADRGENNAQELLKKRLEAAQITQEEVDDLLPPETITGDRRTFLVSTQESLSGASGKRVLADQALGILQGIIDDMVKSDMTREQMAKRMALTLTVAAYGE